MKVSQLGVALAAITLVFAGCTSKTQSYVGNQESVEARKNQNQTKQPASPDMKTTEENPNQNDITLNISAPQPNSTVTTSTVTVRGTTVPNADIFVDDVQIKSDAKGEFSTPITLDNGENVISVAANDEDGNSAEQELTVTYDEQ